MLSHRDYLQFPFTVCGTKSGIYQDTRRDGGGGEANNSGDPVPKISMHFMEYFRPIRETGIEGKDVRITTFLPSPGGGQWN